MESDAGDSEYSSNTDRDGYNSDDDTTDEETPYSKNFDICSIYITNIPAQENNIKDLKNLFSQFGKISDLNLTETGAVIQFMKCKSARRALLKKKLYDITITESWTQPEQKELTDFDDRFYLDHLNDDCLYSIYSNLMLEDQLNLAKISNRQKRVLQFYYELNKTFDDNNINLNHITMYAIKNFLEENGCFIQNFFLYIYDKDDAFRRPIIDFAIKYCPNIKTMKLHWAWHSLFYCFEQFLELKSIETLVLGGNIKCGRGDFEIPLTNLKHLNILNTMMYWNEKNLNQFAKYFQNLNGLKFTLSDIDSFTELDEVIDSLPMLKNLGVRFKNYDSHEQSIGFLSSISKSHLVNSLETLTIECDITEVHIKEIEKFYNLKKLKIDCTNIFVNSRGFWTAINHLIKCNLETLNLYFRYRNMNEYYSDTSYYERYYYSQHDLINYQFGINIINILKENNYSKLFTVQFTDGSRKKKLVLDIVDIVRHDYSPSYSDGWFDF